MAEIRFAKNHTVGIQPRSPRGFRQTKSTLDRAENGVKFGRQERFLCAVLRLPRKSGAGPLFSAARKMLKRVEMPKMAEPTLEIPKRISAQDPTLHSAYASCSVGTLTRFAREIFSLSFFQLMRHDSLEKQNHGFLVVTPGQIRVTQVAGKKGFLSQESKLNRRTPTLVSREPARSATTGQAREVHGGQSTAR